MLFNFKEKWNIKLGKNGKDLECIILNEITQFQRTHFFSLFNSSTIIYMYVCKQMHLIIQCNTSEAEQGSILGHDEGLDAGKGHASHERRYKANYFSSFNCHWIFQVWWWKGAQKNIW